MLKLRTVQYLVTRSTSFRSLRRTTKSLHFHKVRPGYVVGTVLACGTVLCGTCVTLCSCQGSNILERTDDNSLVKCAKWMKDVYKDNIVNSSTLRFGRAAFAVISVFIDYKYTLSGLESGTDEYVKQKSACHLRSAIRLRDLCSSNGGVFMKIGQHVGSLDFLFPKEYTETLKCFQYKAPESSIDDIRQVIESETSLHMNEIFESFEEKPVGSASLAQVHIGKLKNGSVVAVKVQHKTVKMHALEDSLVIEFFVNIAHKLFPEFQFQWLVDQIKANVPLEVDFLNEARNCEKMGQYLNKFKNISVPKIVWGPSTERVLFMEYVKGGAVDDLDYIKRNNLDVNEISTELGKLYSEMIFVRGDIHCDPHAGNILVRNNNNRGVDVILLDHGLYVQMDDAVRLNYCKLWQSMIERDIDGIKKYSECLGVGKYYGLFACMVAGRSWESIQGGISEKKLTADELNEIQTGAVDFVSEIIDVFEKMPRELVLVFKTNDLLRGLDARLKTNAASASFITMSKACLCAVYEDEYQKCQSSTSRWALYGKFKWNQFKIMLYQMSFSLSSMSPPTVIDIGNYLVDSFVGLLNGINNLPKLLSASVT